MLSMVMSSLFLARRLYSRLTMKLSFDVLLAQMYGFGRHLWDVPAPTFSKLLKVIQTLIDSG